MLEKKIISYIIEAQIASDSAKEIYHTNIRASKKFQSYTRDTNYKYKDAAILKAIRLLNSSNKVPNIHYYVTKGLDQNGYNSLIVYFDIKKNGKRFQISFHSFNMKGLKKYIGKGRQTHWRKNKKYSKAKIATKYLYKII